MEYISYQSLANNLAECSCSHSMRFYSTTERIFWVDDCVFLSLPLCQLNWMAACKHGHYTFRMYCRWNLCISMLELPKMFDSIWSIRSLCGLIWCHRDEWADMLPHQDLQNIYDEQLVEDLYLGLLVHFLNEVGMKIYSIIFYYVKISSIYHT